MLDIKKMRGCLPLLPPPGDEVVGQCLDEITTLRNYIKNLYEARNEPDKMTSMVERYHQEIEA